MATVRISDGSLCYERVGDGPTIPFVRGIFGDADAWTNQAARLSDGHTCVRYDRRGYTRSTRGADMVTDAAALIETLGLAPCLVVGSSSGALITVDVALRHHRLLRGVVLSEPPLFNLDPRAGHAFMSELASRIDEAMATRGPPAGVDARFGSGHVTYAEQPDEFENAAPVFAAELGRRTTASA